MCAGGAAGSSVGAATGRLRLRAASAAALQRHHTRIMWRHSAQRVFSSAAIDCALCRLIMLTDSLLPGRTWRRGCAAAWPGERARPALPGAARRADEASRRRRRRS